jgi:hypothetical protein
MRKLFILCAALFCISLTASAQDSTAAFDASSPASEPAAPAPASLLPPDREPWQMGVGFQYQHFNAYGQTFHDFGYRADVTRYLTNNFGLEGEVNVGFGHLSSDSTKDAKSFFIGGGPHVSLHSSGRLEPWVHVLVGWERFRFTQSTTLGSNSHAAFEAGAGADYKISNGRLYWRVQGDFIGAKFGTTINANYSFGTGLVLNF